MTRKAAIEVQGVNALLSRLADVGDAAKESVKSLVEQLAERTADTARAGLAGGGGPSSPGDYPNSDTGRLRASIAVAKATGGMKVGTDMLHGRFLEFGTASMEPRPWLLPSFERATDGAEGELKAEFGGRL